MKDFVHVPYTPLPMRVDVPAPRFLGVDELPCERKGHHFEVSGKCRDCQHGAYDILTTDERIEHARTVAVQLEQENARLTDLLDKEIRANRRSYMEGYFAGDHDGYGQALTSNGIGHDHDAKCPEHCTKDLNRRDVLDELLAQIERDKGTAYWGSGQRLEDLAAADRWLSSLKDWGYPR